MQSISRGHTSTSHTLFSLKGYAHALAMLDSWCCTSGQPPPATATAAAAAAAAVAAAGTQPIAAACS